MTTTKQQVLDLIGNNHIAVERAIIALFDQQTSSEHLSMQTEVRNNRGFNKIDAPFLSSLANQIRFHRRGLTARQLEVARRKLQKYARQLAEIANEKAAAKAAATSAWTQSKRSTTAYSIEASTLTAVEAAAANRPTTPSIYGPFGWVEVDSITSVQDGEGDLSFTMVHTTNGLILSVLND